MKSFKNERSRHEYGEAWMVAAALLDGPLNLEEIKEHYRTIARRLGVFADPFKIETAGSTGPEHHLVESLKDMVRDGWITAEKDRYRLTDTGEEKAKMMLKDLEKGRKMVDKITDPKRVSLVTLIAHFVLASLKLPAALISRSVGLLNDTLDTFMDGISSVVVYFGFRLNKERLAGIVLVIFMLGTGGYTFYEALSRIISPIDT